MQFREHPKPYKFFPEFERMEPLILDHTAMIAAKACLRKYFFQIVLGATPRGEVAPYFAFGSAYHKFREVLEIAHREKSPTPYKDALVSAVKYWGEATGGKDPQLGTKWDFLTRARLMKSCEVAHEKWLEEKKQGKIEVLAVEQPFNVEVADSEFTSGRFDQIVRWNGKIYGRDFKTSSKEGAFYARGLDPNDQFTRYTFAEQQLSGQRVEGQIIEVLYNSKKEGPRITPYLSTRTQWQLDDWKADEIFMRETLNRAREQDRWPKQEHNCSFCQFHSVCKMGSMGSQQAKLKQEFSQKPWDNMTVHLLESEK
jgi:hypothetical protein